VLLREAILRGDFPVGTPLRQDQLAERLGISRIPLREALKQLEGEGFVTIRPHRGAIVAPLSVKQLEEIAEIVRLLEAHLLRIAIPRLDDGALDQAEACLDRLDRIRDLGEWSRVNSQFHTILYRAADRPQALEIVSGLRLNAERFMQILLDDAGRRERLNAEHRAILTACRRRELEQALRLLDAHLGTAKEDIERALPVDGA